ncbi:MAG TPA: hypothetical protein VJ861_12570, partial [Treponemataceae bacterium]|nr:hypothetical protein [Treponemataceae bacterium]
MKELLKSQRFSAFISEVKSSGDSVLFIVNPNASLSSLCSSNGSVSSFELSKDLLTEILPAINSIRDWAGSINEEGEH